MAELRTRRLRLRQWRESDREPFAALNADAEVMAYFPAPLGRSESDALAAREERLIAERGFGLWAVELAGTSSFIGMVGLAEPRFEAHFTPALEIGWRLDRRHWGRGYAGEAAGAALDYGFRELGRTEIVALTTAANGRSRRLMERLGMTRAAEDDFEHPLLAPGDPLRPHVLYRLARPAWERRCARAAAADGP